MHLGDAASWAGIAGTAVALLALFVSVRGAVSKRQRELRGRLRNVLRDVSEACDDYDVARYRDRASSALLESAKDLKIIHDEGILSPNACQTNYLANAVWDLSRRQGTVAALTTELQPVQTPDEIAATIAAYNAHTEVLVHRVASLAPCYRKATRKMDNGNVFIYWYFRVFPPLIRKP